MVYLINREHEVTRFNGIEDIKTYKNSVTENIRVVDGKSGRSLFWYNEDGSIRATKVERITDGKWIVTIEEIDRK